MQTSFRISDLARELGCSEAILHRAAKTSKTPVARETSTDSESTSSMMSKGSSTFSSLPSSASNTVAMTVREAGKKGGLTCLRNRGRGFFVEIGKKGQLEMRRKHPDMASKWGKIGGRPRKPTLQEFMGEAKK